MRHASPSYAEALSNRHRPSDKKELDHIRIREAENGGHVIEHHFASHGGGYHEPESHAFGKGEDADVLKHLAKHMGLDISGRINKREAKDEHEGEEKN